MKRTAHSILTAERMAAAAARRAEAARAEAPVALPAFAEAGCIRLGLDLADVAGLLAFAAAADSEARWLAAGARPSGWADLQEWAREAGALLD